MMKQVITRFAVHRTALTMALLYVFLGLIISAVMLMVAAAEGNLMGGIIMLILFPLIYGVLGYVAMAAFAGLYNLVAGKGNIGITFETKEIE